MQIALPSIGFFSSPCLFEESDSYVNIMIGDFCLHVWTSFALNDYN